MNAYYIKDLAVASYLAYKKIKMIKSYDQSSQSWVFDNTNGECEKLELEVRNGEAQASVLEYESMRRSLLSMVSKK